MISDTPKHIAIIMDGNGRWAEERHLPRTQGHIEGVKRVDEVIVAASKAGIEILTLYTFSTENWTRPRNEVSMLMKTFIAVLEKKLQKLNQLNIRFQSIGRKDGIPDEVWDSICKSSELTKNNSGMVLNIAFNYGSRLEILDAIKAISKDVKEGSLDIDQITEQTVSESLYTKGLPDPDLLIRTSGERRISNFLLWQISYSEFYFTEKFWPDFTKEEFFKAIEDFKNRERRYGSVSKRKVMK